MIVSRAVCTESVGETEALERNCSDVQKEIIESIITVRKSSLFYVPLTKTTRNGVSRTVSTTYCMTGQDEG